MTGLRPALAALALSLAATPAAAQVPTGQIPSAPAPWEWQGEPYNFNNAVALACNSERAFVRSWHGWVAEWNGATFANIERIGDNPYGRNLAVSPTGHVFTQANDRIAEWNGTGWTFHPIGRPGPLGALFALSDARVYVAGRGRVLARAGDGFTAFAAGSWRDFSAVWASSPRDVWLGGQGGAIWRYDGRRWRSHATGLTGEVTGVGGRAGGPLYAVGAFGIARWAADHWEIEVPFTALAGTAYGLIGVCVTNRHVVVADSTGALLVRPVP